MSEEEDKSPLDDQPSTSHPPTPESHTEGTTGQQEITSQDELLERVLGDPSDDEARPDDDILERFKNKLQSIRGLPALEMRSAAIGEALEALPVDEAGWWLDQMIRGALWGREPEYDSMLACVRWLVEKRQEDDYDLFERLFRQAHEDDRKTVIFLLRDPPPHQALPEGKRLPEPRLPMDREVSVGERRSLARTAKRQMLDQLLLDPHPLVVSQVLKHPDLRVSDVLQIATRRPNTTDILHKIISEIRWYKSGKVREALVLNPYNSTGLSLRLLPTLDINKLRSVSQATHIHPTIREAAGMLVEIREKRTEPWKV